MASTVFPARRVVQRWERIQRTLPLGQALFSSLAPQRPSLPPRKTRAVRTPSIDRIGGRWSNLYSNGTPTVSEGTASEADPAATQTRAARTPPIDIIGGRRFNLYSNGPPSVSERAASEADPAARQVRAARTPPIDIIGGRWFNLYSNGTRSVFEAAVRSEKGLGFRWNEKAGLRAGCDMLPFGTYSRCKGDQP